MKIEVTWDNSKIMSIEKEKGMFYTIVDKNGIESARKNGFPLFFVKDVKVVARELPYFVKRRIYNLNYNTKSDDLLTDELESKFEDKNNSSELISPIDKICIKIEI